MPDFPLPNVTDSPAGRMEYIDTFGKRISMAGSGRSGTSPASSVAGDDADTRSNGMSSFPLPSMRAAAKMGILPARFREESASPNARAVGPKPLLLSQAARLLAREVTVPARSQLTSHREKFRQAQWPKA